MVRVLIFLHYYLRRFLELEEAGKRPTAKTDEQAATIPEDGAAGNIAGEGPARLSQVEDGPAKTADNASVLIEDLTSNDVLAVYQLLRSGILCSWALFWYDFLSFQPCPFSRYLHSY